MNPTDVSTWPESSYPTEVPLPPGAKLVQHEGTIALWNEKYGVHVSFDAPPLSVVVGDFDRRVVSVMSEALGGAVFEKAHPGEFLAMVRRRARKKPAESDAILWREYATLNPASGLL